jgi:ATP-dependent Clp protease ATP-binding subunit ClpA
MGMFGQYTETARQMIVAAKHEADGFGSREITPEHLLLALLRDQGLMSACLEGASETQIREALRGYLSQGERNPLPHDLPLSRAAREALVVAGEEAIKLGHRIIQNDHLLLGVMSFKNSYAAELLAQRGLSVDKLRRQIESSRPK